MAARIMSVLTLAARTSALVLFAVLNLSGCPLINHFAITDTADQPALLIDEAGNVRPMGPITVDVEPESDGLSQHTGYPEFLVVNPDGTIVARLDSETHALYLMGDLIHEPDLAATSAAELQIMDGNGTVQALIDEDGNLKYRGIVVMGLRRTVSPQIYSPCGTVDITVELYNYDSADLTAVGLRETLPQGWTYLAFLSEDEPDIAPEPGYNELEFAWIDVPEFPIVLSYRVQVPAEAQGDQTIYGHALYRTDGAEMQTSEIATVLEEGSPVEGECGEGEGEGESLFGAELGAPVLGSGGAIMESLDIGVSCEDPHSADSNHDFWINLSELLRIIQLYTFGGYHCAEGTEDGYAPGAGANHECGPHDADASANWNIELTELLRIIQFYNNLCYRPAPGEDTEDGYAPGLWTQDPYEALVLPVNGFPQSCATLEAIVLTGPSNGLSTPGTYQVRFHAVGNTSDRYEDRTVHVVPESSIVVLGGDDEVHSCGGDIPTPATPPTGYAAREYYGAPLEPFDGIWVGAGQDTQDNLEDFVDALNDAEPEGEDIGPAFSMYYLRAPVHDDVLTRGNLFPDVTNIIEDLGEIDAGIPAGIGGYTIPQVALALQSRLDGLGVNCGGNEIRRFILCDENPLYGNFKIGFLSLKSYCIPYRATAQEMQDALNNMFQGDNEFQVTKSLNKNCKQAWDIEFTGAFKRLNIPPEAFFYIAGASVGEGEPECEGEEPPEGQEVCETEGEDEGEFPCSGTGSNQLTREDGYGLDFVNGGLPVDLPLGLSDEELEDLEGEPGFPDRRAEIIDEIVAGLEDVYTSREGNRPFFLRIGYEANNGKNNYCPDRYKVAFQLIVKALRGKGWNFASVWHVEAATQGWDWTAFYPGDEWVDWIGTSIFYWNHLESALPPPVDIDEDGVDDNYENQLTLVEFAAAHNKPLIVAESSPINYGVAACPEEEGEPSDDEVDCGDDPDAGEDAWTAWFGPFFGHIQESPQIKAISYINKNWAEPPRYIDWQKNALLGSNSFVAGEFREELDAEGEGPIYRTRADVESELGGCQPYRIYAEGAEWRRFLPNGNLIITKGQPHASWSNWSTTGPLAQPPVFAIVDPRGRALLVVDRDSGDMYTRLAIHTGQSSIEASGFYYTANDAVLMRLTNTGEMFLRGVVKAGTQPTSQQWSDVFPGNYRGDGCEQEGEIEGESLDTSCNCFEGTPWFVLHPCEYPK